MPNRTNLRHFGPSGRKSDPGLDKEALQQMEVRSMFGQVPLPFQVGQAIFFLTSCGPCGSCELVGHYASEVANACSTGLVFGQIGPTGW